MTNCISCGTEIPVKEILAGNYKKVEGNTYCLSCAGKITTSKAAPKAASASSSGGPSSSGVRAGTTATKSSGSSSSGSSSTSIPRPGSGTHSGSGTRSGAGKPSASTSTLRASSVSRRGAAEETEEEDEPRRGYVKKEDPTLKIVTIVGIVSLTVALGVFGYNYTQKKNADEALTQKYENSRNALEEIRKFLTDHQEDASNNDLEALIKKNAPLVVQEQQGDIDAFRNQLEERRSLAAKRKKYNELYAYVRDNVKDPAKAEDVKKSIAEVDKLIGLPNISTDAERKDYASFKVLNGVALLESKYNKALDVKEKNPDNYPMICEALTIAEEQMSEEAQTLSNIKVPGAERAKELYAQVVGQVNLIADQWASSEKYGFAVTPGLNLLDPKEFTKQADKGPRWFATSGADYKQEGGAMVMKGIGSAGEGKDLRAGIIAWAPGGSQMTVVPGTKDVLRNYELTLKFKVVRKGFTLLARHTKGYQRHSYSFDTAAAQEEIKKQNKKSQASGQTQSSNSPANDPFGGDVMPANTDGTSFVIEEGKSYEVVEKVYGDTVRVQAKTLGSSDQPEPVDERVRARYGGLGFQLLPGAEVIFESISIKILN